MIRCAWCGRDPLYVRYHDEEWGKPVYNDQTLFEFLILESAQAGLSWITILRKRENYRKAFANFDAQKVAEFTEQDVSGVQGIYGAMDRAYDFDSEGPGKAGPYQEFSHGTVHSDLDDEFEEIDEDLQEDFKTQKNKIKEMFNRFNKYN